MKPSPSDRALSDKLRTQLSSRSIGRADPLAFAVLSGSFNPVHNQHLSILERSRTDLEDQGWVVVGGFLAPSSDDYVTKKLGLHAMSLRDRVQLCKIATAASDWIAVCDWGELSSFRLTRRLRKELRSDLGEVAIVGIEIMGADTVTRLMTQLIVEWDDVTESEREPWYRNRIILCIGRAGADSEAELAHITENITPRAAEFGVQILITAAEGSDRPTSFEVSSTLIRELLEESDWASLEARGLLDPGVLAALKSREGGGDRGRAESSPATAPQQMGDSSGSVPSEYLDGSLLADL